MKERILPFDTPQIPIARYQAILTIDCETKGLVWCLREHSGFHGRHFQCRSRRRTDFQSAKLTVTARSFVILSTVATRIANSDRNHKNVFQQYFCPTAGFQRLASGRMRAWTILRVIWHWVTCWMGDLSGWISGWVNEWRSDRVGS